VGERSNDESFRNFVIERGDALLRTSYLLCGDRGLAEDLLQTALWNTCKAWPRIRDPRRREQYVRRSLLNGWLGWQRRSSSRELTGHNVTGEMPSRPVPDHAEAVAEREQLVRALAVLPVRQRAVVVLPFYEDMTERQVARVLHCSVGTVKHQAADALAALGRNQALRAGADPLETEAQR
jgi:RNA polymerase sigma-70 factor (sigma-E family)